MKTLEDKLYYKPEYTTRIINQPEDVSLNFLNNEAETPEFVLVFIRETEALRKLMSEIATHGDSFIWLAYPKQSGPIASKLNRDVIWDTVTQFEMRPVAQVSIDATWSAIRLKPGISKRPQAKSSKLPELPKELIQAFEKNNEAAKNFNRLSKTNKKEFINWISKAKKAETRDKRLRLTIDKLLSGKKNPYDK